MTDTEKAPEWFHSNGNRMRAQRCNLDDQQVIEVVDTYSGANLNIWLLKSPKKVGHHIGISWGIPHKHGMTSGNFRITVDQCRSMFGLDTEPLSIPGLYIRSGNYLNIPGPNRNGNGDPNLSVFVGAGLQLQLTDLLSQYRTKKQ